MGAHSARLLDTGKLPPNPPTHINILTANRQTALATARAMSAGALTDRALERR